MGTCDSCFVHLIEIMDGVSCTFFSSTEYLSCILLPDNALTYSFSEPTRSHQHSDAI